MTSEDLAELPDFHAPVFLPEQLVLPKYRTEYHDFVGWVLVDAINTLIGRSAIKRSDWELDRAWVFDDSHEPWSFLWCCKVIDLNHNAVRQKVLDRLASPVKRKAKRRDYGLTKISRTGKRRGRPPKHGLYCGYKSKSPEIRALKRQQWAERKAKRCLT